MADILKRTSRVSITLTSINFPEIYKVIGVYHLITSAKKRYLAGHASTALLITDSSNHKCTSTETLT